MSGLPTPKVIDAPAPAVSIAGTWPVTPAGVILHGSRSGIERDVLAEFQSTVNFAESGALDSEGDNLGWNATIGPGIVAVHIDPRQWGWNARGASHRYLAVEFAQGTVNDPIDDSAVDAFVWWFLSMARDVWPDLPAVFPTHASLPEGQKDGKTDAFPLGDPRADDLVARIKKWTG